MRLVCAGCVGVAVAGCGFAIRPHAAKPPPFSPLLHSVQQMEADGTPAQAAPEALSAFQMLLRDRLPRGSAVIWISALEVDVPDGLGDEGSYLAVLRSPGGAELRYFEQADHHPRLDRFYVRALSAGETAALDQFVAAHPMALWGTGAGQAGAATPTSTRPAKIGAETQAGTQTGPAEGVPEEMTHVDFRITEARSTGARSMELAAADVAGPAADLIKMLRDLRDAGPLACVYFQPIPKTAALLFAEPFRHADRVWVKGDDVRALISDPVKPLSDVAPEEKWYTRAGGEWTPSDAPPGEATTEPAATEGATTQPATTQAATTIPAPAAAATQAEMVAPEMTANPAPRTGAVVPEGLGGWADPPRVAPASQPATPPSPFSTPDMLSQEEAWWTEPAGFSTVVWHYVPLSPSMAQRVGFTVPGLVFDDAHMAVDAAKGKLYLIHEGQVFELPIPGVAMVRR